MRNLNTDLTRILKKRYAKKWVALNSQQTKVIASGKTPKEVLRAAQNKGIDRPVVTLVPEDYRFLVS